MTQVAQTQVRVRRRPSAERRVLGWSEGDAWTVGIGLVIAMVLALSTIPAVLDARNAPRTAAPRAAAIAPAPAAGPGAGAAPAAEAAPPATQPLLGPLVPLAPTGPAAREPDLAPLPEPAPPPTPAAAAPLPPGAVRLFASLTGGGAPGAVVAGPDGTVSAGTDAPDASAPAASRLLIWDTLGALRVSSDVPEQPGTRSRGLTALGLLTDGALVAVDASTARILRYDGAWSVLTRLPDLVTCVLPTATPCQPGLQDSPPLPRGIAVDKAGVVFVADAGQGTVWRLRPGQPIEVWYQSADLMGSDGVAGMAFDEEGHLLAAVTRLAGVTGPGAGALIRIERGADGAAAARTVVSAFRAGEEPVDVAIGASGSLYVPLRGADALVVLDRRGVEALRIVDDAMKAPTAVELVGGRALVTAAGPPAVVLQVGVADRPAALK